jgi:hypothetical protein
MNHLSRPSLGGRGGVREPDAFAGSNASAKRTALSRALHTHALGTMDHPKPPAKLEANISILLMNFARNWTRAALSKREPGKGTPLLRVQPTSTELTMF